MKFKAGDNIIVIENDVKGTVTGVIYNSINQCDEYIVKWANLPYEQTYPVDECDSIWKHNEANMVSIPMPRLPADIFYKVYRGPPLKHIDIIITIECGHDWKVYDSGFRRFKYCAKCNEEKHEN